MKSSLTLTPRLDPFLLSRECVHFPSFIQSDVFLRADFLPSTVLGVGEAVVDRHKVDTRLHCSAKLTLNNARTSWSSFSSAQSRLLAASCKGPFTHLLERLFTLKESVRS